MSRLITALLVLGMAAATAAAASPKKNPDVEREIRSDLVGKTFNTKILVGSYIQCPQVPRNDALKMVDTELTPEHKLLFFARANCFYPGGTIIDSARGYVNAQFRSEIPPGSVVWVRGVDFKDDRVEVRLSMYNNDNAQGSGKIKYMLGESYRNWPKEQVMEAIAQGLRIPALEAVARLKSEFELLRTNLQGAEGKYKGNTGDPESRLADAISVWEILQRLQRNRSEFAATGKSDPQAGVYSEQLAALTAEIAKLKMEARGQRVALLRSQLQSQLVPLSEIQIQVRQKPAASLAEWQQRVDLLTKYSALLDERQKLLSRLQNESETPSPEDLKSMNECRAEVESGKKSLEAGRLQIELGELTSEYRQLAKTRSQKLDAYSRAFATSKERSALQELIAVLGQMVTNRERASELGDKSAASQLAQCKAETEKFKRK